MASTHAPIASARPGLVTQLHTPDQAVLWLRQRVTGTLHTDSRKIRRGDGFIAWPGAAHDGRGFVVAAQQAGAAACLVEEEGAAAFGFETDAVASYTGLKAATGPIAAAYFDNPSRNLDVIAITGTNGKTTTAWWLAHSLSKSKLITHIPCGLVGTLGVGTPYWNAAQSNFSFNVVANGLTTPDPILLQASLRDFAALSVSACALEASSIGIEEHRLNGTRIHTAVFTNFTQDHLDYHGSMQAYWRAKSSLFEWPGLKSAVVNIDDPKGAELAADLVTQNPGRSTRNQVLDVWTVSCREPARLQACDIGYSAIGVACTVVEQTPAGQQSEERHALNAPVMGLYNLANLLGVIAAMRCLGVPLWACIESCKSLEPVPGRMASQGGTMQPLAVVDYAHTPDALSQALQALRPVVAARGGQLWCVFGCGGDRDVAKRPLMGAAVAQHADRVVVTSDNPRREKPQTIISQILLGMVGFARVEVQSDRALAIGQALAQAAAQDVVLVAGKGHETYQDIAGTRLPFSDQVQVAQALQVWTPPPSEPLTAPASALEGEA